MQTYIIYLKLNLNTGVNLFTSIVRARDWIRRMKMEGKINPIDYVMIDNNNHWYDCDLHESWY
jgi:hypothetical protein